MFFLSVLWGVRWAMGTLQAKLSLMELFHLKETLTQLWHTGTWPDTVCALENKMHTSYLSLSRCAPTTCLLYTSLLCRYNDLRADFMWKI